MKMNKFFGLIIIVLWFLFISVCVSYSSQNMGVEYDSISLTGKFVNGKSFQLMIEFESYINIKDRTNVKWVSPEVTKPNNVLNDFVLKIDGECVNIPRTAFHDLFNVSPFYGVRIIQIEKDEIKIQIKGGDGAASYKVFFYFKENRLIKRTGVHHGGTIKDIYFE